MGGVSLAVVDDHAVVRDGIVSLLRADGSFGEVLSFASGQELLTQCRKEGLPDLIISDVRMPVMGGFQLFEQLKKAYKKVRLLFLAGSPVKREETTARDMGASGYLPKSVPGNRLVKILRQIASGSVTFACEEASAAPDPSILSDRELVVLRLLAKGLTRDEIAVQAGVGVETVKTQVRSILLKLDVPNSVAAVATAYERGLL